MKYAVVTGASSGIGAEFCRRLDQEGYQLLLVARRKDRLEQLKEQLHDAQIFVTDLSQVENCYQLFNRIKDKEIDVFINNAGFGDCGLFCETDINKEKQMIDLNIKALHILMKLVLKKMMLADHGMLLNVASSAGLLPAGPYMASYYATKSYVTSLTMAVARELKEQHSHVYLGCLCPGPVHTEFNQVANVEFALKGISPQDCVDQALKKMKKRKVVIIPGTMIKIAVMFAKILPVRWVIAAVSRQQKKKIYE